ncbi:MAG TPA: BolA family protein [Gammaproteobacteria bacterium]|nr:BolA family protein [Gammaproteobacteria bacterium]
MSVHADRVAVIKQKLEQAFSPTFLDVVDDSEKHKNHPGHDGHAGHYTIVIAADCFINKSRIEVHREIYACLGEMIPGEIHAICIQLK